MPDPIELSPIGEALLAIYDRHVLVKAGPNDGQRSPRTADEEARCTGRGGRCGEWLLRCWHTPVGEFVMVKQPRVVRTDAERREVWIWDKVSSEVSYSRSSGMIAGLLIGGSGGGAGGGSKSAGASRSSQRTLTVIVKFDDAGLVRDFSYRTSSF